MGLDGTGVEWSGVEWSGVEWTNHGSDVVGMARCAGYSSSAPVGRISFGSPLPPRLPACFSEEINVPLARRLISLGRRGIRGDILRSGLPPVSARVRARDGRRRVVYVSEGWREPKVAWPVST